MIPETMKAAVMTRFGSPDVVRVTDHRVPKLKADQVLIRNHATTLNSGDSRIRSKNVPSGYKFLMSLFLGFKTPRIKVLGTVFAGEIVAVGTGVKDFNIGDRVFGSTELKMRAHAEYVAVKANGAVHRLPDNLPFDQAASTVFGTSTAIHFLKKANVQSGERILINGAAGSVGIAIVQMAKARGLHVTAIAASNNHEFLRENGADAVIDYNATDLRDLSERYDVVADCPGKMPYAIHRYLLKKNGRFLMVTGTMMEGLMSPFVNLVRPHKIIGGTSLVTKDALQIILRLHEAGNITAVIDKHFDLEDIVAAHTYVDTGHKRGNVVITV